MFFISLTVSDDIKTEPAFLNGDTLNFRIVIQNKSLHDYKCSGKCRVSDGVDFILQVLQRSTRFTFSRSDDNTIIYIK